ncbi:MAG: hypothetical protein KDA79_13185 [Planctomycetaceae bacterium]|nr:hypothetical protein [Planctomycetaceae bacterium]
MSVLTAVPNRTREVAEHSAFDLQSRAGAGQPWLVNPWFDALFLSNVFWPVLAVGLVVWGMDFHDGVSFWQVYFVTTPHRWITLALVFLDRDRFAERPVAFATVAGVVLLVCLGVRFGTGGLTCLLIADYLWNAWHFASQHSGILRIYTRRSRPAWTGSAAAEKILLRTFVLYVILRVSGLAWSLVGQQFGILPVAGAGWSPSRFEETLQVLDWCSLVLPALLVVVVRPGLSAVDRGRTLYLASFLSLYVSMLAAVHLHRFDLLLILTLISALFHATEYLAIVSWAMQKKFPVEDGGAASQPPRTRNLMAAIVPHWVLSLTVFCVALGLVGWISDVQAINTWLTINVAAAFLHYWYDGMIWKRPRRRRAAA